MIFIDTTIWVSAIDANDQYHRDGSEVLRALLTGKLPLALTNDYVLDETLTILKKRVLPLEKIVQVVRKILSSPRVEVLYVDETLFSESLEVYKKYKGLSFTDSATLTIMMKYGIKEVYSHDGEFDKVPGIHRKERPAEVPEKAGNTLAISGLRGSIESRHSRCFFPSKVGKP